MGFLYSPIVGRHELINRPVQLRIIQSVLNELKLTNFFSVGLMNDDASIVNPNALLGDQNKDFKFNTAATNRVVASFEEQEEEDWQQDAGDGAFRRPPLLFDESVGLSFTPRTMEVRGVANLAFRIRSRAKAEQFYTRLRNRLSLSNQLAINAEYRIPLTDECWYVADAVCEVLRKNKTTELSTWQYIQEKSLGKLVQLADINGKMSNAGYLEIQNNILLQYQTVTKPEVVRNEEGIFEVTLPVSYYLQVPNAFYLRYPNIIGKTPLPEELIQVENNVEVQEFYSYHDDAFREFARITPTKRFITFPDWDVWEPILYDDVAPFFSTVVVLGNDNRKLMNIADKFGAYSFSPAVQEYLLLHRKTMGEHLVNLLNLHVYKEGKLLRWDTWELQENGDIVLNKDGDSSVIYRVLLSGSLNWKNLGVSQIPELCKHGENLVNILPIFLPKQQDKINAIKLAANKSLKPEDFELISNEVNRRYGQAKYNTDTTILTVGAFDIFIRN